MFDFRYQWALFVIEVFQLLSPPHSAASETDFPFTLSKDTKPTARKQTNKTPAQLPKPTSPLVCSICPWPTFLPLPLAWEVLTGSRRGTQASSQQSGGKVRWMCTVECSAIEGERPLRLSSRAAMQALCHPWKAATSPLSSQHSSTSPLIRAQLCALMYFNQAHLLLPSILPRRRALRVTRADAPKS